MALANVQLHLESAFRKFFREPSCRISTFKSKKHSRKSYTTNAVNGNIFWRILFETAKDDRHKIKLHRRSVQKNGN